MMLLNVMGILHPVTAHHSLQRDVHLELNVKHMLCDSHCVRCFHILSHLITMGAQRGRYYYTHFTVKGVETMKCEKSCLWLYSGK